MDNNSQTVDQTVDQLPCYTTAAWRVILTNNQLNAVAISIALLIPPVLILNATLCVALFATRQLNFGSKLLVFVLSVSDCVCGLLTMPAMVILLLVYGRLRVCWFERLAMIVGQTNGHFSFYIMLALALQRFVKVKATRNQTNAAYNLFWTKHGLVFVLIACLSLALMHGSVSVYFFGLVKSNIPNIFMMLLRSIIVVAIYALYFQLYFSIKRHLKSRVGWQNPEPNTQAKRTQKRNQYDKFFKTVALIMGAFILCFLPLVVTDLWTGYYSLFKKTAAPQMARFLYFLFHSVLFMNGVINAIIFIYKDPKIMNYLQQVVCQNKRKRERTQVTSIA